MTRASDGYLLEPEDPPSKREILAAALQLFVQKGLGETSIRDIGQAAGYTNPALYKFFPTKDALALYLFERCYLHVFETVTAHTEGTRYPTSIKAFVTAWGELVEHHLPALLYVDEQLRNMWPHVRPTVRRRSLIAHVESLLPARCAEPRTAVALVLGTCAQLARQRFFDKHTKAPELHALESLLVRGLDSGGKS